MNYAPIALFTYNRYKHTRQTIESLLKNSLAQESELYIFSDGAKKGDEEKVESVRAYLKTISGFKAVHIKYGEQNKGLANSIIDGVTSLFQKYPSVIVLEDDLQTSPHFLQFMNDALNHYSPNEIWSIAGYSPNIKIPSSYQFDSFLVHRNCSWGWATWKQNWEKTDWNISGFNDFFVDKSKRKKFERGGNDLSIMFLKQQMQVIHSWSVRFNFGAFTYNLPTVYPVKSLVKNLGVDGSGTHMKQSSKYNTTLATNSVINTNYCSYNNFNTIIEHRFKRFYNTSLYRRVINLYKTFKAVKSIKKPR
ncbi:glycosyltransferase family 2 protein [Labilibacter sediminis]|nr:glycosyltransferase family 2 protein [Labilibacter sediminis]